MTLRVAYCRPGDEVWPAAGGAPPGWCVLPFEDCGKLEEHLRDNPADAAVMSLRGDPGHLSEALSRLRVAAPGLPVIVAAPQSQEEDAAASLLAGAADYWLDSMSPLRLRLTIEQAVQRRRSALAQNARDEALERVSDSVVVADADERIVYWNRAASRLYGYEYAEVVGRLLPETLSPLWLDAETRLKAWRSLAARGVWLGETVHARRDGTPARVSVELSAPRDGRGRRAGLLMIARPAEAGAAPAPSASGPADARRFLERLLDSVADPIFVKDRERRVLLANEAFYRLIGRPREAVLGRPEREYLTAEQADVFERQDDLVFESGRESVNEELVTDGKGVTHVVVTKKTLGRDADGRPVIVAVARDVTLELKSVEELKNSRELLGRSQKLEALGRLAGGVAHDFNNIVTAIIGGAGILLETLPPGHRCREEAEEIRRAGESAAAVTRQLLSFSRREEGRPRSLDLREAFGAMRRMLARLLPADIELEMVVPDRLRPVRIDPGQAEQVLLNLVVNAGDAMAQGGRITVALSDAPEGGAGLSGPCVLLSVADEGPGMDESTRARIFEPFFTTKAGGTGLGLAIVRDIVQRGGGAVTAESAPGGGSTFRVFWPVCSEPPEPADGSGPARTIRAPRPARVLVVEDDDAVRRFAVRALELAGYEVSAASDCAEAVRLSDANEGAFDALVVDVVLPRMRGPELAGRLRSRQPTARVLFTSGYRVERAELPRDARGEAQFLPKPFTGPELAEYVRRLLEAAAA